MSEKDDGLGLSLSLSLRCPEQFQNVPPPPPQLQQPTPPPLPPATTFPFNLFGSHLTNSSSSTAPPSSAADRNGEQRSVFRGIDMNKPITIIDCDEELIVSSPNSTVSDVVSGKRSREREENEGERGYSSLEIEYEDGGDAAVRKKLRLSKEQATVLEQTFKSHNTLNVKQKLELAKQLNLRARQVEVWFQNRRARTKLKQTEIDCEYLKRCCEKLSEDNLRLNKEVSELRALKLLSPQFCMNMTPPTTLTMCPQCQRVDVHSSSSTATSIRGGCPTNRALNHQRPMPLTTWATYDAHRP